MSSRWIRIARLGRRSRPLRSAGPQDELEERALEALRLVRGDRAPEALRARIERLRDQAVGDSAPRARRPIAIAIPAAAVAGAVVAVALALPAGTPGSPSVGAAAQLALRGPALAGPAPDPSDPSMRLSQSVQGITFPNWARFGWRASGWRVDRIGGRSAVTVFYARGGRSIAYTILAMPALRWPGGRAVSYARTRFELLSAEHRLVVTWRRGGHTCILSGAGAAEGELLTLASWPGSRDGPSAAVY